MMPRYTHIADLAGLFTCEGFSQHEGRKPSMDQIGFIAGPIDILKDRETGKILEIGRSPDIPLSDCRKIDGADLFAAPGFIDSHTHALYDGTRGKEHFMRWRGATYLEITEAGGGIHNTVRATSKADDGKLLTMLKSRLGKMKQAGTSVVEVKSGYADTPDGELRLLRLIKDAAQDPALPTVYSTFLGLHAIPPGRKEAEFVDRMLAILPIVAEQGLARFVDAFPEKGFFSLKESIRFVEAAQKVGLKAKIHADEITDMAATEAFVELGALSVDHLQCINKDRAVKILANSATVATLMPATSFFLDLPFVDARGLLEAGCKVALATDFNPGSSPYYDFQTTNLLAASKLRMNPAEILCAVTVNGAQSMGLPLSDATLQVGSKSGIVLRRRETGARHQAEALLTDLFVTKETDIVSIL